MNPKIHEMSIKKESDTYTKFLDLIDKLAKETGRSQEEARYTFFSAIEMGAGMANAYTYALQSLIFLNVLGVDCE